LGPNGATLGAGATYTIAVTETGSNGGPQTPGALTLKLDNPKVGTLSGNTLLTGVANAAGNLTVSDASHALSQTVAVTVLSTHPVTDGDTLTLAGTLVHTIDRPVPAPSSTQPPSTTTANVTDVLTITSTSATFGGQSGLIDENSLETDASPLQSIATNGDAFTHFVSSGSSLDLFEVGSSSGDSNGVKDTVTFGPGAGLLDELPDANGAAWQNTAAQTFLETEPDTTTLARTTNADGTYTETDKYLGRYTGTTTTSADLSAALDGFEGLPVNVTYGAPSGSGTSASIPFSIAAVPPAAPGILLQGKIPDWYPSPTIFADSATKTTAQAIPASCNATAGAGTTATAIVETTTHLDTALGTYETRTQTLFFAPGVGVVCAQLADIVKTFYDYTGQSPSIVAGLNVALSATPIQIDTLAETVGFKTGSVSGSSVARTTQSVSSAAALRLVTPLFDRAVQAVFRTRREALVHYVTTHRAALEKEFSR
jgi:hypothetical protein